jgi:HD-GYP domain-containing protein (c-di-GMP phosphodiesterase class II)
MSPAEISAKSLRAKAVRFAAGQVLTQLLLASKVEQLYGADNENVRKAYEGLAAKIGEFFSTEERFELRLDDGYLFANEVRLRVERATVEAHRWFVERLVDSGIATVSFEASTKPVELRRFLPIFVGAHWGEGDPAPPVAVQLEEAFVVNVRVTMRRTRDLEEAHDEAEVSVAQLASGLWFKLHAAALEVTTAARSGRVPTLKRARSLIQVVVDAFGECEAAFLSLTRLKYYVAPGMKVSTPADAYLETHLTNTCLLTIALGSRLGLARGQLLDAALAALVFDVGMALVPRDITQLEGPLGETDRATVREHALRGAELLLRADGGAPASRIAAMVAATHHADVCADICPEGLGRGLLASIVAVADAYDAMTTERPWRDAIPHDRAIEELMSGKNGHHALLAKMFANVIGMFPAGSIVELSTGEHGQVVGQNLDPRLAAHPKVKVVLFPDGAPADGYPLDLAERNTRGGFVRSVKRLVSVPAERAGHLVAFI